MKKLIIATFVLFLSACGGSGGGPSPLIGQFIDDPVGGLSFSCTSVGSTSPITGTTDADGHFKYILGQICTFKVGNVTLGTLNNIPSDGKVTPQDVAGVSRSATASPSALAIAQFLQSLNDGSASGKIVIPAATATALGNVQAVTLASNSGAISQADLQTVVSAAGKTLVSAATAKSALDTQISSGNVIASSGSVSATAPVVLNSIAVSSAASSNAAGLTEQLTATGYFSDGSTKDLTSFVTWSSLDTSMATVSTSGLAQGLKKGSATITASLQPSGSTTAIKGAFLQTTTDPVLSTINITNSNTLPAGLTDQLFATGTLTDGSTVDLTKTVRWSSSDSKTLTVDANGLVTGVAMGVATVNANYTPSGASSDVSATFSETVLAPKAINLVIAYIQSGLTTIQNFATTLLKATVSFTNNTTQAVASLVDWEATPYASATVAVSSGINSATLTASKPGVIFIIGSYLGLTSNTLNLTVTAAPPVVQNSSTTLNVLGVTPSTVTGNITATDPQGYPLNYAISTQGNFGQATINNTTGVFTYVVPGNTTSTTDSFNVTVSNGVNSTVSQVSVLLNADPLLRNQWHIQNVGYSAFSSLPPTSGFDMNVAAVWAAGYSGKGIKVAVVDTGLEIAHEDLVANIDSGKSYNFVTTTLDPSPSVIGHDHGTQVSGIIGAAAFNGKGGRGVSYNAMLRGYNLLAAGANSSTNLAYAYGGVATNAGQPPSTDLDVINASFGWVSTSLPTFNSTSESYVNNLKTLRNGKGSILVKSAGNNYSSWDNYQNTSNPSAGCTVAISNGVSCGDSSNDQTNTSPVPIIVGAFNANGVKSSYSNAGASIWISAPGGESGIDSNYFSNLLSYLYKPAIVTTALTGCQNASNGTTKVNALDAQGQNEFARKCQYTALMNGTSSAAPNTAGVVALMLEANSNLSYRDVKHILAKTAKKIDSNNTGVTVNGINLDSGWTINAAGFNFSNSYGFGAVDASAAVNLAKTYTDYLASQQTKSSTLYYSSGRTITGAASTLSFQPAATFATVEQVAVTINLSNAVGIPAPLYCNQIELISPSGTRSVLMHYGTGWYTNATTAQTKAAVSTPTSPYQNAGVRLLTNAFYGEPSAGTWNLKYFNYCNSSLGTTTMSSTDYQTITLYGR